MKRHQALSFAVVLALSAAAVNATLPSFAADRARWIPVEARNHATGAAARRRSCSALPTNAAAAVQPACASSASTA